MFKSEQSASVKAHEYKAVWEWEGGAGARPRVHRNAVFHLLLFICLGAAMIHFYVLLGDALLSLVLNITDAWRVIYR